MSFFQRIEEKAVEILRACPACEKMRERERGGREGEREGESQVEKRRRRERQT